MSFQKIGWVLLASALIATGIACERDTTGSDTGTVQIDGSSTVYPITEAVAEEFLAVQPRVRVPVGVSGTGGGFKRFTKSDTDISNASRPIKTKEAAAAKKNGVEFLELPVAYDGLSIVVHPKNDWANDLTIDELRSIFTEPSQVALWSEVRAGWPATKIKVYMPGADSGTFDYFKEVVAGKEGTIRSGKMFQTSEDDNVLVIGVAGDKGSIGFFGCAYFFENKDKLRAVSVVNPVNGESVLPTSDTIESGSYAPFSRPLFIYVNKKSLDTKPAVADFVDFYLEHSGDLATEVGYVRLPKEVMDRVKKNVAERKTGSHYLDAEGNKRSGPLSEVYN